MACRCCVTNCNRNYNANNKVKTVRLLRDPDDRNRWRAIIPRDNIPNKKGTVIRPQCLIMWNPVLSQLCYKLQELGTKKVWVKHDHDRLALFSERDKVYSLKSNNKSWWVCYYIIRVWWNNDHSITRLSAIISCAKISLPYK